MTGATVLLRQVHPSWVQAGFASSQAFRPTPKDESKLSVFDGDLMTPEASLVHFTAVWHLASAGVAGVTVDECAAEGLPSHPDPLPDCPEHAVVNFSGVTDKECVKRSKKLKARAEARGWLYFA